MHYPLEPVNPHKPHVFADIHFMNATSWWCMRGVVYVVVFKLCVGSTEPPWGLHWALKEMWSDLLAQDWSAVKGFIVISNLTESDCPYHILKMKLLILLHVTTYYVAVLYYYFDIVSTGWYLKLWVAQPLRQERTQSQLSLRYQVCLQSFSFFTQHGWAVNLLKYSPEKPSGLG